MGVNCKWQRETAENWWESGQIVSLYGACCMGQQRVWTTLETEGEQLALGRCVPRGVGVMGVSFPKLTPTASTEINWTLRKRDPKGHSEKVLQSLKEGER